MATRIKKTDLARDALYDKVNTMIDEVNTKIDNKDSLPSQTGNAGKFLTTDGTNASWGKVKQIKIKQDLTNPSADTVPSTKAVKDESSRIVSIMDTKVSNCITEIPQDIKLELNNGTLTLKAGSKVYIPNGKNSDGSNKFDTVTIASDINFTYTFVPSSDSSVMLFINQNGTNFVYLRLENSCFSGTTKPSGNYRNWYNTNENRMYSIGGNATIDGSGFSFPIAKMTQGSDGVTKSIDQVFNGFGYIGSTIFALPGVKGLIPNGRNADGSLKNSSFTTTAVQVFTGVGPYTRLMIFESDGRFSVSNLALEYDEVKNKFMGSGTEHYVMVAGSVYWDNSSKITSFTPKTVFHALDYNDKSTISGWSMPSGRYIDLTLGASGSTYTAPANGWFCLSINTGLTYLDIYNNNALGSTATNPNNGFIRRFVPAFKGDILAIYYLGTPNIAMFRFFYAEGEKV